MFERSNIRRKRWKQQLLDCRCLLSFTKAMKAKEKKNTKTTTLCHCLRVWKE
jgi:hypothetical protein